MSNSTPPKELQVLQRLNDELFTRTASTVDLQTEKDTLGELYARIVTDMGFGVEWKVNAVSYIHRSKHLIDAIDKASEDVPTS